MERTKRYTSKREDKWEERKRTNKKEDSMKGQKERTWITSNKYSTKHQLPLKRKFFFFIRKAFIYKSWQR